MERNIKLEVDRDLTDEEAALLETLISETLEDWGMEKHKVKIEHNYK